MAEEKSNEPRPLSTSSNSGIYEEVNSPSQCNEESVSGTDSDALYTEPNDNQGNLNEYARNSGGVNIDNGGGYIETLQAESDDAVEYNDIMNKIKTKIKRFKDNPKEFLHGFESTHDEMRADEETFIIVHLLKKNEPNSPILDGNLEQLALLACCKSPYVVKRALDAILNEIFLSISDPFRIRCHYILKAEKILRESFLDFLKVDNLKQKCQRMTTYAWLITFVLLKCSKEELAEITLELKKIDKTLDALLKENCEQNTFRYGIFLAKESIKRIAKDGNEYLCCMIKRCEKIADSELKKDEVAKLGKALNDGGSWLDLHVCLVFLQDLPKFYRFQSNLNPIILIQMLIEHFRERCCANKVKNMLKISKYEWKFEILVYHVMLRLIRTSKTNAIFNQVLMGEEGCGGVFRSWAQSRSKTKKDSLVIMNVQKLCKTAVFLATPDTFRYFITNNCKVSEEGFIKDISKRHLLTRYKDKVLEILPKSEVLVGKQRVITYDALMSGKKCLLKLHQHSKEELLKTDALKNVPLRKEIQIISVLNAAPVPCPSIVQLFGSSIEAPMHMIIERGSKGDLQTYLKDLVDSIEAKKLLQIAQDICNAMIFLEEQNIIHRDLRAKNCFVFMQDGKLLAKLGNFHLAVLNYSDPKSQTNLKSQQNSVTSMIKNNFFSHFAVPWMAIEVLQVGEFSTASDVWSFGVLLFEIFTLGCKPYDNMPSGRSLESDEEVREFVVNGNRLELHPKIPDSVQALIQLTMLDAQDRPKFSELKRNLLKMNFGDKIYPNSANFQISFGNILDNQSHTNLATDLKDTIHDIVFKDTFIDRKSKLKKKVHKDLGRCKWLRGAYGLTGPNRKIPRPHIFLTVKRDVSKVDVLSELGDMFDCDAEDYFELLEECERISELKQFVKSLEKSNVESKASTSVSSVHLASGGGVFAYSNPSYDHLRAPEETVRDDLLEVYRTATLTMFCSQNGQYYALTCCHISFANDENSLNASFDRGGVIRKIGSLSETYRNHAKELQYYITEGNIGHNDEPISFAGDGSNYIHLGDFDNCHFDNECDILSVKVSDTTEVDCKIEDFARPDWDEIWNELYDGVIENTSQSPVKVEKIGFSSALTHGYVVPCHLSYKEEDILFQDAYVVKGCGHLFMEDGDSGSPVFFYDKNNKKQVFAYAVCQVDSLLLPEHEEPPSFNSDGPNLNEQHKFASSIDDITEDVFSTDGYEEIVSALQRNDKNKCKDESINQHEFQNEDKIQSKEEYKDGGELRNEYENKSKSECVKDSELEVECQHENVQMQCEISGRELSTEDENKCESRDKIGDKNDCEDNKFGQEYEDFEATFQETIEEEREDEGESKLSATTRKGGVKISKMNKTPTGPYFICFRLDTNLENLGLKEAACFNNYGSNSK